MRDITSKIDNATLLQLYTNSPNYTMKTELMRRLNGVDITSDYVVTLDKIKHAAWLIDIPSPGNPDQRQFHENVQSVLKVIDKEIDDLQTRLHAKREHTPADIANLLKLIQSDINLKETDMYFVNGYMNVRCAHNGGIESVEPYKKYKSNEYVAHTWLCRCGKLYVHITKEAQIMNKDVKAIQSEDLMLTYFNLKSCSLLNEQDAEYLKKIEAEMLLSMHNKVHLTEVLYNIRHQIWLVDIPHPTTPYARDLHETI